MDYKKGDIIVIDGVSSTQQQHTQKAEHTALKNYFWGNEYTFRKLIKVRELVSVSGN